MQKQKSFISSNTFYFRDPYNMLEKIEMPGFWGVKNMTDTERGGVPGQAQLSEIYKTDQT